MKECEAVLELNKMLFSKKPKYIFLDEDEINADNWEMDTMRLLSEKGIFIDGFASGRKDYIGAVWCNKKVVDIANIHPDAFICTRKSIYSISDRLKSHIIVFGAGLNGDKIAKILKMHGRDIKGFVDSDLKRVGQVGPLGKTICGVDSMEDLDDTYSVVLAGVAWEEMLDVVTMVNPEVSAFWFEQDSLCGTYLCNRLEFEWFDALVKNKGIYIYGINECIKRFIRLIQCMEYQVEAILADEETENVIEGIPVKLVEDIVYESDFFIAVDNKDRKKDYEKLTSLGLQYAVDFSFIRSLDTSLQYNRVAVLDVNLGYSYIGESKYPGFTIYGDDKSDAIRIVTLGGSTTDGGLYPFKSWPEILYEKWPQRDVVVFNGGVAGYHSGHDLFKLIRDVLELRPDIIIEYGTHNDIWMDAHEPYAFPYVKKVFEYADRHLDEQSYSFFHLITGGRVGTGILWDRKTSEIWLRNIIMMHELARMNDIQFYSFIQPDLFTKKNKSIYEQGIWINNINHEKEKRMEFIRSIKENAVVQKYNYIYDLTDVLDDYFNIYLDLVHVNEKANEIIADAVLKIVGRPYEKL